MKNCIITACLCLVALQMGVSQNKKIIGGGCEGCELYAAGLPKNLDWETTMAVGEKGEKLQISGVIYQKDGKTPAPNVILYIYHTDIEGLYKPANNQTQAKRHGRLRGWMKTDAQGRYQFTTIRPASYPNSKAVQHIHPTIKEPNKNEYWIDEFVFEGDPNLTEAEKKNLHKRGGNGIVKLVKTTEGVWVGKRDIVLGLNVPDYF